MNRSARSAGPAAPERHGVDRPTSPLPAGDWQLRRHAVMVSCTAAVRALCEEIRDPSRTYPVVGLTSRRGEGEPALAAVEVHALVGDDVPIYFIPTGRPTVTLKWLLPERLNVFGGAARVWWPGVSVDSDPAAHPLIYDPHGVYGRRSIEELARCFRAAPAAIAPWPGDGGAITDEQLASELAALGHPVRLRIMRAACTRRADRLGVVQAGGAPGSPNARSSSHAQILRQAGLLVAVDMDPDQGGSETPGAYAATERGRELMRALSMMDA